MLLIDHIEISQIKFITGLYPKKIAIQGLDMKQQSAGEKT